MQLTRLGLTPVKGGRHRSLASVALARSGPIGDRVFALVDPATNRCLRTVENPALVRARARWDESVLSVDLPSGTVAAAPVTTGRVREVDYWGRRVAARVVDGPWAEAYAELLGRDVLLTRVAAGEVVYGAAVTLVTRPSVARLADELGAPVDPARVRATVELDADLPPYVEDGWVGRRLRLGEVELRLRGPVPRCAVVDLHPATGIRDLPVLATLATYRRRGTEVWFGVDAEVTTPGRISVGDQAWLLPV